MDDEDKNKVYTELKHMSNKQIYIHLNSFEARKGTTKIKISLHKLSILTGQLCKI